MTEPSTLINFPCDFPIKIIGVSRDTFVSDITAIVLKHFPTTSHEALFYKKSERGNYIAMTATVYVSNQSSLDALYHELTQYPGIKMVL